MRPPTSNAAFSLIELLVAVAVATLVLGAALALILHSFDVWGRGMAQTGELRATDDFDLDFDRDFASACPALGFQGTERACVFWTLRPGPDGVVLSRIRYAIDETGVEAERWAYGEDLDAPGLATRYPTRAFTAFSYGGTNLADNAWQSTWDCPTGMPQSVSIRCAERHGLPRSRLHGRLTGEVIDR